MQYPSSLLPTAFETLGLPSGRRIEVPITFPVFEAWAGESEPDYGRKTILSFNGKPAFAELVILGLFLADGWDGVWVDTFAQKYRTSYWPKNEKQLPPNPAGVLEGIFRLTGTRSGCWDVFCWKEDTYMFAESKRRGRDQIRGTQKRWLEAAIESGLSATSFLLVEWSVNRQEGSF